MSVAIFQDRHGSRGFRDWHRPVKLFPLLPPFTCASGRRLLFRFCSPPGNRLDETPRSISLPRIARQLVTAKINYARGMLLFPPSQFRLGVSIISRTIVDTATLIPTVALLERSVLKLNRQDLRRMLLSPLSSFVDAS